MSPRQATLLTLLVIVGTVAVGLPAVTAQETATETVATQNDTASGMGTQLTAFLQSNSAATNDTVENGMWKSAYNQSDESERARLVTNRAGSLEQKLERLQERNATLEQKYENGTISEQGYVAQRSRLTAEIAGLQTAINDTDTAAEQAGVDDTALERLKQNASEFSGQQVASVARGIAGPPENVGPDGSSQGPPEDAGANRSEQGPPDAVGPNGSDQGPPDDTGANQSEQGPPADAPGQQGNDSDRGPPDDTGNDSATETDTPDAAAGGEGNGRERGSGQGNDNGDRGESGTEAGDSNESGDESDSSDDTDGDSAGSDDASDSEDSADTDGSDDSSDEAGNDGGADQGNEGGGQGSDSGNDQGNEGSSQGSDSGNNQGNNDGGNDRGNGNNGA